MEATSAGWAAAGPPLAHGTATATVVGMPRIALLSTSDTDLLSARASGADYALANPARLDVATELPTLLDGADLVDRPDPGYGPDLAGRPRRAGRARAADPWCWAASRLPDAELMRLSTVPIGVAAQAHRYLAEGGAANLRQLHAFCQRHGAADRGGFRTAGSDPRVGVPGPGHPDRRRAAEARVGILIYRAHHTSGNTAFVHALADAVDATGDAVAVPMFCSSLRTAPPDLLDALGDLDALVVTVLAAGGTTPANASAGGDDDGWDVSALAALDIPILQGLCLTWSREAWAASDDGLSPLDVATQVAVPEFDGRIITVPFSFKETDPSDDAGLPRYVADPERCARVAADRGRARPAAAHPRGRTRRSAWCCPRTRRSTPGSATRSAWTPRLRRSGCCGPCGTPATTSASSPDSGPSSPSRARNRTPPPATR